jgi:hypothetical protein
VPAAGFFLLRIKCEYMAALTGVAKGSLVLIQGSKADDTLRLKATFAASKSFLSAINILSISAMSILL